MAAGVTDRLWEIADIDAYEAFCFGKLRALPGVQEINSSVALSEIKSTNELPILSPPV